MAAGAIVLMNNDDVDNSPNDKLGGIMCYFGNELLGAETLGQLVMIQ